MVIWSTICRVDLKKAGYIIVNDLSNTRLIERIFKGARTFVSYFPLCLFRVMTLNILTVFVCNPSRRGLFKGPYDQLSPWIMVMLPYACEKYLFFYMLSRPMLASSLHVFCRA